MRAPQQGSPLQNTGPITALRPPAFGTGRNETRLVFICCIAFFLGYLPGILLWRMAEPAYGAELAAWCIDSTRYAHWGNTFIGLAGSAFLQLSGLLLSGFCVFGLFFLVLQFSLRGAWLGFCAAGVFRLYGAQALLRYRLLDSPADLLLLFSSLYLSVYCAKSAGLLYGAVFLPPALRSSKITIHRVLFRYLFALLLTESALGICAGFSVLLTGLLP